MAEIEIPRVHKAAVYDKPGTVSTMVTEVETPQPGPGQVLVRLTHSGVCASDVAVMKNGWKSLPYPTQAGQVGGHEGVGKVVKLGPGAENSGIQLGDRVGIKWISSACGSCPPCLAGQDGLCHKQAVSGYYHPGTFQQYVLGPANYVTSIPDGLDSAAAAPMLCAGVTVYSALRKSATKSGEWVVLLGAGGGLGHIATQLASRGMALRVIGIDHSSKESLVRESGAEVFFPFDAPNLAESVIATAGGLGAHAVINLTSSNEAYASAISMLRFQGRLVCVGIPYGESVAINGVEPGAMVTRALSVVGVAVGNRRDVIETLDFAVRGIIKAHYQVAKLDQLTKIFEDMCAGKLQGRVVLDLE